jgi:hypothetical protein
MPYEGVARCHSTQALASQKLVSESPGNSRLRRLNTEVMGVATPFQLRRYRYRESRRPKTMSRCTAANRMNWLRLPASVQFEPPTHRERSPLKAQATGWAPTSPVRTNLNQNRSRGRLDKGDQKRQQQMSKALPNE